jgi:hypothetical protein
MPDAKAVTIQHTTEFVATSEEAIQAIASDLATSDRKYRVFKAVYSGGNQPKNATVLASRTNLTEVAVMQLATPMAHKQYLERVKHEGRVAFKKYQHINAVRGHILKLAKNPKRLEGHISARTPKQSVSVRIESRPRHEIRVTELFIDDVDEFKRVAGLKARKLPTLNPKRLPERVFKYGIAAILGNKGRFQDWGGEKGDLYSSFVTIRGRRKSTAFALKGPATSPPLTPKKLGKNGDQIQRLFAFTADAFFIQFEGRIDESVKEQMLAQAIRKSHENRREIFYGLIGLEDSHRLRARYAGYFDDKNVPGEDE